MRLILIFSLIFFFSFLSSSVFADEVIRTNKNTYFIEYINGGTTVSDSCGVFILRMSGKLSPDELRVYLERRENKNSYR